MQIVGYVVEKGGREGRRMEAEGQARRAAEGSGGAARGCVKGGGRGGVSGSSFSRER